MTDIGGFNERRLALLLDDLDKNKNVGCVLKELAKLKIPETTARNFNVLGRVTPFQDTPLVSKLVAIIIRKNKRMSELNRVRRVRFAEKKSKKAKVVVVSPTNTSSNNQSSSSSSSSDPTPSYIRNAPTPAEFPLKYGPGLNHSDNSPFRYLHPQLQIATSPVILSTSTSASSSSTSVTPATNPELRGLPYIQHLYQQVKMQSTELSQVENPTVDQVLEEMSMVNCPAFLLNKR